MDTIFFILDFFSIVLVIGVVVFFVYLHIDDKRPVFIGVSKEQTMQFNNHSNAKDNTETTLTIEQKYATMGILFFFSGFCAGGRGEDVSLLIVSNWAIHLKVSVNDAMVYCMNNLSDEDKLIKALRTIENRDILGTLFEKCTEIANLSNNQEALDVCGLMKTELQIS